jgi:hypothetical protein
MSCPQVLLGVSKAYVTAYELRRELGYFQHSPFPPWSQEDMDWFRGMDDASGDYGDIPDPRQLPPLSCPLGSAEVQLSLFD